MIIKQSNLLSALTHLRAALSTLAPEEDLNGEQVYIREQLEEVETLLNEANEPEEPQRGIILTHVTEENKREHFSYRKVNMMIEKEPDQSFTLYGMGKIKRNCDHGLFHFVNAYGFEKTKMDARRTAYETLRNL